MHTRLLEVRMDVMTKNASYAVELRHRFQQAGVFVVNIVSGPGAGKTALLEKTLPLLLAQSYRVAVLVGDLATDNDARRLAATGVTVRQIETVGNCHLEAQMIEEFLGDWDLNTIDFLFIENVGNLVCPANYDLGEALRVILLSTAEGEDKPLKYPPLFRSADLALITKMDLAEVLEFDHAAACRNLNQIRADIPKLSLSARSGQGMDAWLEILVERFRLRPQLPAG